MTKMFCDRCGAEIPKGQYAWLSRKIIYTVFSLIPNHNRTDWENDDKHLCSQCEDEFVHWFMHSERYNAKGEIK